MQIFDAEAVHAALPYARLIEVLRRAHLGPAPLSDVIVQSDPLASGNMFVTLPGWLGGELIAVKMVGVFPGNLALDPPQASVQGLVAVFDAKTGGALMVADGEAMTFRKTAADSALGATFLARAGAEVLLIVGAGGLAPHVAEAHCAARPSLRRVMIWNRTAARAETLAARLRAEGKAAEAVTDLDAAVEGAMISKFRNNGQTCVCANRIYVQAGVYDAFAKKLSAAVEKLNIGDGLKAGVTTGPLINAAAVDNCYNGQCGSTGCYCGSTSLPGPAGAGSGTIMSYCHSSPLSCTDNYVFHTETMLRYFNASTADAAAIPNQCLFPAYSVASLTPNSERMPRDARSSSQLSG